MDDFEEQILVEIERIGGKQGIGVGEAATWQCRAVKNGHLIA